MKNRLFLVIAAFAAVSLYSNPAQSQVYVKVRPSPPVVVVAKPAPPSTVHVWIEPEWRWEGGTYVYVGGRWAKPKHRGHVWVPGHWDEGPLGYRWMPGHWAKR